MVKKTIRVGGLLSGNKVNIENGFVMFRGTMGRFQVQTKDIEKISVSAHDKGILKAGKSDIQLIGGGTVLAEMKGMPATWAEKLQRELIKELNI